MDAIEIRGPDTTETEKGISLIEAQAEGLYICDNQSLAKSADFLRTIKTRQKSVTELFGPAVKAAHLAHKEFKALENDLIEPLKWSENKVKAKIANYTAEEERKRVAEEQRIREAARVREDEERLRLAEELEKRGESIAAEEVISHPSEAPMPVLTSSVVKTEGVSMRKVWKYEILDKSMIPREWLIPNTVALASHARSMKDAARIAGVRFYSEDTVAARGF